MVTFFFKYATQNSKLSYWLHALKKAYPPTDNEKRYAVAPGPPTVETTTVYGNMEEALGDTTRSNLDDDGNITHINICQTQWLILQHQHTTDLCSYPRFN